MKDKRIAALVVCLGHMSDNNDMIAPVVGGFKIAFKCGQRPFDNGHATM